MEFPPEVVDEVRTRLRRAAGQVQAVERMLADGRDCREVLTQLVAARRALEQAGLRLLAAGLTRCLSEPEQAAAEGYSPEEMERLFLKLS